MESRGGRWRAERDLVDSGTHTGVHRSLQCVLAKHLLPEDDPCPAPPHEETRSFSLSKEGGDGDLSQLPPSQRLSRAPRPGPRAAPPPPRVHLRPSARPDPVALLARSSRRTLTYATPGPSGSTLAPEFRLLSFAVALFFLWDSVPR